MSRFPTLGSPWSGMLKLGAIASVDLSWDFVRLRLSVIRRVWWGGPGCRLIIQPASGMVIKQRLQVMPEDPRNQKQE